MADDAEEIVNGYWLAAIVSGVVVFGVACYWFADKYLAEILDGAANEMR